MNPLNSLNTRTHTNPHSHSHSSLYNANKNWYEKRNQHRTTRAKQLAWLTSLALCVYLDLATFENVVLSSQTASSNALCVCVFLIMSWLLLVWVDKLRWYCNFALILGHLCRQTHSKRLQITTQILKIKKNHKICSFLYDCWQKCGAYDKDQKNIDGNCGFMTKFG